MKVGDIKVAAIKLMFTNYAFDFNIENLQSLISDENYGSYIVNMNESIARAIDRIENACVVPTKRYEISIDDCEQSKRFIHFDTTKISDLYMIDRISAEYGNGDYAGNVGYEMEGDLLILPKADATYTIIYYPTIKSVDEKVADEQEFWIPDKIARLIPYFIKGDLYQEEEPDLAADARNTFEACLDDLKKPTISKQDYVDRVYRM